MKKNKTFDAVKMMRKIRDRMSEEMKGMSAEEQIEYIETKSGLRRERERHLSVASDIDSQRDIGV